MFGVQDTTKPVFLLDNAHTIINHVGPTHIVLSKVLDVLVEAKPVCIVAGTNDGYLEKISNHSNFVV